MADEKKPQAKAPGKAPQQAQQGGGKKPAPAGKGGGKGAPATAAAPVAQARVTGDVPPRIRDRFRSAVIPALMKERGYTNPFQVPRLSKIVVNMGVGEGKENAPIGCKVTLRGPRMFEFLDRLINVALPRVRDFKGVPPKGFDGRGYYNLGLREQVIFPEIVFDKVDKVRGMDITMVTTAGTDEEARALLFQIGLPFRES